MRPSTVLQYWILLVAVPLVSLAAPVRTTRTKKSSSAPHRHPHSHSASHHLVSQGAPHHPPSQGTSHHVPAVSQSAPHHLSTQGASHHVASAGASLHPPSAGASTTPPSAGASGSAQQFSPGQIVMAKGKHHKGWDVTSLSKDQKNSANLRHPHVVIAGPHADGTYTVAPTSSNPDPLGKDVPVKHTKHLVPKSHTLKDWVLLKSERLEPEHMELSTKHPAGFNEEQLGTLKGHMEPYENWKHKDAVAHEHTVAGNA